MSTEAAHFHCQYKKFTRAKGQSAVQAAAYRLAATLPDERTGLTHNYTRKRGVTDTLTIAPSGVSVPAWAHDPARLWNEAEAMEKTNPRALVMHEWEIALPHALNPSQRREAAREMAQFIADRYGCMAMAAFHNPNREGDQRNYHIHLMFTPRAITEEGFSKYKFRNYSLRAPEAESRRMMTGAEEIVFVKSQWAAIGNRHLERAGFAPTLDHRSYQEQGVDLEPQKHLGPEATAQERRGERTAKGDFNRAVRDRNKNRREWALAWQEARADITGTPLPVPPQATGQPSEPEAPSPAAPQVPPPLSKPFMTLMENQKQERTSLIHLHVAEKIKLWREEQELRASHKQQWARLYARQRRERQALATRLSSWKQRFLRTVDITGRTARRAREATDNLERQQRIKRAEIGREQRKTLRNLALRLQEKHERELLQTDTAHLAQRQEVLSREERNRTLLHRLQSRQKTRDRDPGRDR